MIDGASKVLEVFADVVCPFTHIGLRRLVAYRDELGRDDIVLRVRAWPLEWVNGERLSAELLSEEIAELRSGVAPDLFSGFDPTLFPMSSLPALALAARAYRGDLRCGEQFSLMVRDALFEHGCDISDPNELAAIGDALHLDAADETDRIAVRDDLEQGRTRGVIGSPHFFLDGTGFFCPSLAIERVDGELRVGVDREGFADFVDQCFGSDRR